MDHENMIAAPDNPPRAPPLLPEWEQGLAD
jgi:hypothetical protein